MADECAWSPTTLNWALVPFRRRPRLTHRRVLCLIPPLALLLAMVVVLAVYASRMPAPSPVPEGVNSPIPPVPAPPMGEVFFAACAGPFDVKADAETQCGLYDRLQSADDEFGECVVSHLRPSLFNSEEMRRLAALPDVEFTPMSPLRRETPVLSLPQSPELTVSSRSTCPKSAVL